MTEALGKHLFTSLMGNRLVGSSPHVKFFDDVSAVFPGGTLSEAIPFPIGARFKKTG